MFSKSVDKKSVWPYEFWKLAKISTLAYECVDPRCENLTKCIQAVNSLTNTIVWVNTFVEIFTPSLFMYCFGNLTIKVWLSQSHIFYLEADEQINNLFKKE